MRKGLIGLAVGAIAAAWAAKRFFGSSSSSGSDTYGASNGTGMTGGMAAGTAPPARREGLDPTLLEILACPDDKQPVIYQREGDAERLTCTKCGKRYPVRDGIPVMLIDEATPGPIPTEEDIAAAKAVAKDGKPAIVGAASSSSSSGMSAGTGDGSSTSGASAPSTTASPTASDATAGTASGENAPTGTSSTGS